jgi:[acyl-carrier-protein] S-malonyltransferase
MLVDLAKSVADSTSVRRIERSPVLVALFPGQGSLRPGMGAPWRAHPSSRLLDEIGSLAGVDVRRLVEDAELAELVRTDNAQLATFALSTMVADAAGVEADLAIGHSLGEYSALHYAGILDLEDATRLVVERGRAMAAASAEVPGSMVAVLGATPEQLEAALAEVPGVVIANENAPGQTVVAGSVADLATLRERSRELGLRKVLPLEVGGAFHSPLMAPALPALRRALESATFATGRIAVVANVDAERHDGDADWVELLSAQLTGAVRFASSIEALPQAADHFVELGPGGVLAGLVKRIRPTAAIESLGEPGDLEASEGAAI